METKHSFGSNPNMVLTRQTCGKRSSMAVGRRHRVLAFYFPVRICDMFVIGKHRPKGGGVNCKSRDYESRRWREFGIELKEGDPSLFKWNTIIK